jgi:hypothetical protein
VISSRASRDPDAELRRRSAWRVLLPVLVFGLVLVTAVVVYAIYEEPGPGSIVLSGGFGLIAIWAVLDGVGRAIGRATYLGTGRGLDRLFGLIQAGLAVGLAFALLPNTVALLNFIASLGTGGGMPGQR